MTLAKEVIKYLFFFVIRIQIIFPDSGGPLQIFLSGSKCMHSIIGVTSFGSGCGNKTPALYSFVPAYIDWIEEKVWGQGSEMSKAEVLNCPKSV